MSQKTINLDCGYSEIEWEGDRAVLILHGPKHRIRVHADRWLYQHLANNIWDVVKQQQKVIDELKTALRGGG